MSDASQPLPTPPWRTTTNTENEPRQGAAPVWVSLCAKAFVGITVGLYILNQKHLLPKPLSRIVSKALFWPTLPITVGKRLGSWTTVIDDTVIMGGAPFGFAGLPEKLYEEYGVRGVINYCEEYRGPLASYRRLGIAELHLPTADHFEPTVADFVATVRFIQKFRESGSRVYVHCRAGHGRSAAGVFAWLLAKDPNADAQTLNRELGLLRDVRKTLWKQPNLRRFHAQLKEEGHVGGGPSSRSSSSDAAACDEKDSVVHEKAD